jgi:hypothetical protein
MSETFDQLLIRILFSFFICIALLIYKYAHVLFYPSAKKQIFNKIYYSENPADTIHLFSRIIGVCIVLSPLEIKEYLGIGISSFHFFIWSTISFCLYLLSIFLIESIFFYNFTYVDEILKKKNMSYGVISFTNAICLAYLTKVIIKHSDSSLVILLILWLYSLVLFGFTTKLYQFVSQLSFNRLMIQKDIGLGFSYAGFLFGATHILSSAFISEHTDITSYGLQIFLKVLLSLIIFPVFIKGLKFVFKLQEEDLHDAESLSAYNLGQGIFEGALFIACAYLTTIITGQIYFGTIYPFF